jgi:hypothetical protein
MTITVDDLNHMPSPPLDNPWVAGAWIAAHHPWAEELMRRVGSTYVDTRYVYPDGADSDDIDVMPDVEHVETGLCDVDQLAETLDAAAAHSAAWAAYEEDYPEPRPPYAERQEDADEGWPSAYDEWLTAGPGVSKEVYTYGVMSSGEKRVLRVLAMLGRTGSRVTADDFETGDERGAPIVAAVLNVYSSRVASLRALDEAGRAAFDAMATRVNRQP